MVRGSSGMQEDSPIASPMVSPKQKSSVLTILGNIGLQSKENSTGTEGCQDRNSAGSSGRASYKFRTSVASGGDVVTNRRSFNPIQPPPDEQKELKSTFIDAEAMKEKVRANLMKPQHRASDAYKKSGVWQAIARSPSFEYVSLTVVALNALWIAVDTDNNSADLLLNAHPIFIVAENMFCLAFFLEWLVKFLAYEKKVSGLKDSWFMFDSLLVFMMVMETWVMSLLILMMGGAGGIGGNASLLRIARLLRLSRMARMARLLRALPELMIMIRGMVAAARSVFFTLCLLIVVLYVFAIAFTQLTVDMGIGSKYFSTVPDSMFTLLIFGTLLDNIGLFANEVGAEAMHVAVLFFVFVLIAALTIMNMLIGVLCEVVNAVAATEREEMLVTYVHQKLQRVVHLLDTDGGGTISKKEFLQILDNIDAVRCLNDVGVDVIGLVDFVDFIFESDAQEDDEECEVELDFGKFMDVVLQLRGCNNATVKDVVDLRKLMKKSMTDMKSQITQILHFVDDGRHSVMSTRSVKSATTKNLADIDKNGIDQSRDNSPSSRSPQKLLTLSDDKILLEKMRQLPDPIPIQDHAVQQKLLAKRASSSWEVLDFPSINSCEKKHQVAARVESDVVPALLQPSVPALLLRNDDSDGADEDASPLLARTFVSKENGIADTKLDAPTKQFHHGVNV